MLTTFQGKTYDLKNLGFKIHLPVVGESNDPLTRAIVDFLDQKFGLDTNTGIMYETPFYKVGSGGETTGGKGISIYGRTSSLEEMKYLAEEIEQKFGIELADNVKKYNLTFEDPLSLTKSVKARFAAYDHNPEGKLGMGNSFFKDRYSCVSSCGALRVREFTTLLGEQKSVYAKHAIKRLSDIDMKFLNGDSIMYSIDTFGEFFTGKVEKGKIPQVILESLPEEYRAMHNLTDKNIIARIDKGTRHIVAVMLKDAVENPDSKILMGKPPWLATLNTKVLDEAKQLLGQTEPETLRKLEQTLPQLTKKCPALAVLEKAKAIPKTQVAKELDFADSVRKLFKNPTVCKTGLCVVGAVALAGVATSIFAQNDSKELLATNKPSKQTNIYGNCFSMPKDNMTV